MIPRPERDMPQTGQCAPCTGGARIRYSKPAKRQPVADLLARTNRESRKNFAMSRLKSYLLLSLICSVAWCASWGTPSLAAVERKEDTELGKQLTIPLYQWTDPLAKPAAVVVALHGATLHAGAFDPLARRLADKGYRVYAPDMRGFGKWHLGDGTYVENGKPAYYKTREDLVNLVTRLKEIHPGLPVYLIGESLGSNMALWMASFRPDLIDGILVSSVCKERRSTYCGTFFADFPKAVGSPHKQVSLTPYARRYLSEDKNVLEGYLSDPYIRKSMSLYETLQCLHANKSCLEFVNQIPANFPILVLQGEKDRMYKADAVKDLLKEIPSQKKEVVFLKDRGHIHLETEYLKPDVLDLVNGWLARQTDNKNIHMAQSAAMAESQPATMAESQSASDLHKDDSARKL